MLAGAVERGGRPVFELPSPASSSSSAAPGSHVVYEGTLNCKMAVTDGKVRSQGRNFVLTVFVQLYNLRTAGFKPLILLAWPKEVLSVKSWLSDYHQFPSFY